MNNDYDIVSVNIKADAKTVIQLWDESFPNTLGFNYKFDWLYVNNIYENTFLYFLQSNKNNTKVGVQGVSGRIFKFENKKLPVGLIGDFAVDKRHRTLWPAMTLLKSTLKKSVAENSFVYSFPNINAIPVVKRAGYKLNKMFKRYVKINRVNLFVDRYLPSILSSVVSVPLNAIVFIKDYISYRLHSSHTTFLFDDDITKDVDLLWNTSSFSSNCILQERNKKYLDWRMQGDNKKKTYYFILRDKSSNNVIGYIAFYIDEVTNNALIVDFYAKDQGRSLKSLFVSFVFNVRYKKINSISLEFLGLNNICDIIKFTGFKFRDERPMFYVFNEKTSNTIKTSEWFLTSWDEDAV